MNSSQFQSSHVGLQFPDLEEGLPSLRTRSKAAGRAKVELFGIPGVKVLSNITYVLMADVE